MVREISAREEYVLEVVSRGDEKGDRIPLSGCVKIGRGSDRFTPDIYIPGRYSSASREHACIDVRGGHPTLEDASRYGTLVDGNLVSRNTVKLREGARITFGKEMDGWRVIFKPGGSVPVTTEGDLLELLEVVEDPPQVRFGENLIEENLGRDAFRLLVFLYQRRDNWFPLDRLEIVMWTDENRPIAARAALAKAKRKINNLLRPYLNDQDAVEMRPFRGYRLKSSLDETST